MKLKQLISLHFRAALARGVSHVEVKKDSTILVTAMQSDSYKQVPSGPLFKDLFFKQHTRDNVMFRI